MEHSPRLWAGLGIIYSLGNQSPRPRICCILGLDYWICNSFVNTWQMEFIVSPHSRESLDR
jgi:hypothetical protein